MERRLTTLEFNRKNGWTRNHDRVNSTAEPGHLKFKVDVAVDAMKRILKQGDFLLPGARLLNFEDVAMCRRQGAENLID